MSIRIEVRRTGWGMLKAPPDLARFIYIDKTPITNPAWISWNRDRRDGAILAVNIIDELLLAGEYEAELQWQYYSNISEAWYKTDDPRIQRSNGLQIRLVYVKVAGSARII